MSALRVVSHGGGWQTTALLVLAAQRRVDFEIFLFANVGDDSENPGTIEYFHRHAKPYAEAHGIQLHELHRRFADGRVETLYGRMTRPGSKALPIPVYGNNGSPMRRSCTVDFKIAVVGKWLAEHGATEDEPATVALGYSVDEIHRTNAHKAKPYERLVFPLLDLRLRRVDCAQIITDAGLPMPPKSACWFCPFRRIEGWHEMRRAAPTLFNRAVDLEGRLTSRGRGGYWLTDQARPLEQVIPVGVETLPMVGEDDAFGAYGCDGSACGT